jgi:predicted ATPase/Arc/MetJ-type ribon-helix-helix transcriptional regulator
MNRIREWLGTARLVTVLGPAGSGKTRLATEVGKTLLSDFESSGVWFVDLAPVRSPDGVVEAIAKPLGISGGVDRHTESVLTEYLNDRRMVLILDNCEHLVARVAEVTDHMLRSSAKLVVIATSRERLGVDGEAVFDLAPLPYPAEGDEVSDGFDAVRLFNERARTSDPGYPSESEPKLIGEIVRRLDGIPLAIELAAARVRSLGLPGLRDRLDDRFKILTSAKRHGIDRHQTLVGAIDWSYLLLTADEQVLFTRLNVFRSSFNLEAAIDVCGFYPLSEDRVVDLLSELVDKSFVTTTLGHEGERRYFMLEMLREYGRRELDAAKAGHLRSQHAHYYCRFAEKAAGHLNGPAQGHWFHALSADHDNLRKALQWAATVEPSLAVRMSVALSQYWDSVGPRSEGHEWLRRSVEMSASLGAGERLNALLAASALFSSVHVSLPLRYAEDALVVARDIGDEMGQARALRALSWAHALEADTEKAVSSGLEALQMFEKLGDRWELAHCLERLGQANVADVTFSLEMLGRALDIYLEIGDKTREALLLYKIAERVADNAGDLSMARSYVERALAICDKLGNINDGAHARLEYGKILRRCGEYGSASAVLREALEQLTKSGDERCSVRALAALGVALIEGGESDEGIIALVESLRRGRDLEEGHTTRAAIAGLAGLIADAGDLKAGVTLFGFAEAIGREMGAPVSEASQERRQSRLNSLRDRLGSEVFDTAWDRGQVMQVENAVDLAVEAVNAG